MTFITQYNFFILPLNMSLFKTLLTINLSFGILFLNHAQGNLSFEPSSEITVKIGADTLSNAWAGGINFAQFSTIDFDFDGDDDLFCFDRSGDELLLFENTLTSIGRSYNYVSNGDRFFPKMIYRAALVDYNLDGKKDLFCYATGGFAVYKNVGDAINGLQWQLIKSLVYTDALGTYTNLFISAGDIPAYTDVDNDGDIDVLTFSLGGDRIEYHQNQSQEIYNHSDSLLFILKNECWGQFRESNSTNEVELNSSIFPCGSGNIIDPLKMNGSEKHTGSAILAFDVNNNGVKDLLIGDVSHADMTLLINSGAAVNTNSPIGSQETFYPQNTIPIELNIFPAAYYEDINFDGIKDLIVTPNARTISENQNSVWRYTNTGSDASPVFNYVENDFLQDEMIDHGIGSIPILVDQNADGLKDLVIAHFYRYKPTLNKETSLLCYRNVGSALEPSFQYLSDDLFGLLDDNLGLRLVPTYGDQDLILGRENGTLLLFTNTAGAGSPMNFSAPNLLSDQTGTTINLVSYTHPQLFDINEDGKLDLLVGKKTGEIAYYQNTGSTTSPEFTLVDPNLGNVDVSPNPDGYCATHFFKYNDTLQLFVGSYAGTLMYFNNIEENLHPDSNFVLINSNYLSIDVGLYSSFAVDDMDQDGNLDLFIGQDLGGIWHWEADPNSSSSLQGSNDLVDFLVFPNPTNDYIYFNGEVLKEEPTIQLVDFSGKIVKQIQSEKSMDIKELKAGTYVLKIISQNNSFQRLIIKL
jgi:hypothetical protein